VLKPLRLLTVLSIFFSLTIAGCTKGDSGETPGPNGNTPDSLTKNIPTRFKITEYEADGSAEGGYFSYQYDKIGRKTTCVIDNQPKWAYSYNADGYLTEFSPTGKESDRLVRDGNTITLFEYRQKSAGENYIDTAIWIITENNTHTLLTKTTANTQSSTPTFNTTIGYFRKDNLSIFDSSITYGKLIVSTFEYNHYYASKFAYDLKGNMITMSDESRKNFSVEYEDRANPLISLNKLLLGKDAHFLQPTAFETNDLIDVLESQVMLTPFNPARPGYEKRLSLFHSANLIKSITFYYTDELTQTKKQDTFYFTNTFDSAGRLTSIAIKLGTANYYQMQMEYK
jgi:hypothetical protein